MMDKPEQISEFFDSLNEHEEQRHKHRVLWEHVQKVEAELDTIRENNDSLNKNFKDNIEGDDYNISTKYVNLKDRHDTVLKEIENLKNKFETLKINIANQREKMALESEAKIRTEEELHMKRIDELKSKIENRKLEHKVKVEKLNNKLELAHATADLKLDEIETTLRGELMDLNMKIWRQQNANTALQIEIDDLKRRQQANPTPIQNYEDASNPDHLQFFHLDNLDDLFNISITDDNVKRNSCEEAGNHTAEQKSPKQLEAIDDCNTNANVDVNKNEANASASSKYPPLQIIRKRRPYSEEREDTTGSGPGQNNTSGKHSNVPRQTHFEFGILNPTAGNDHMMMMISYGQRGGDKPHSILKIRHEKINDANIRSVERNKQNKRAAQKVTFATDTVTSVAGSNNPIIDRKDGGKSRPNINNKRATSKGQAPTRQNDKKSLTKKEERNKPKETTGNTVKTNPPKKRKLFNLDDLDYLDHIQVMNSDDSD